MVVHFIDNLDAASGGTTFAVIELAKQQALRGERVRVVCAARAVMGDRIGARIEAWSGLEVQLIEQGPAKSRRLIDPAAAFEGGPRIAYVHGLWDPIVRHATSYARRIGIPWLLFTHGMLHPAALARRRWRKLAYGWCFPWIVHDARCVVCLNAEERDAVKLRHHVAAAAIPNGIDVAAYSRAPSARFRHSLPNLGESPFVLFLGRLDPIKGVDRLIQAFGLAVRGGMPHHLVVAGPDSGELAALVDLAKALGVSERIHFCGPIWGDRKLDALAECSMFAHRPRYEGFGIAVAEALASGKPVVTTAACRMEGAKEAGALVESADESEAFAKELLRLADNEEEARLIGERGRVWAADRFGWGSVLSRLCQAEKVGPGT